jgi:hypothetical protein
MYVLYEKLHETAYGNELSRKDMDMIGISAFSCCRIFFLGRPARYRLAPYLSHMIFYLSVWLFNAFPEI